MAVTSPYKRRVFVVQDDGKNFTSALDFGEVTTILQRRDQVTFNARPWVRALINALSDFTCDDYIILVGDPAVIGIACAIVAYRTGGVIPMLKWDRQEQRYFPVTADISSIPAL